MEETKDSCLYGFAGVNGGLYKPAKFVDTKLPPGYSSQQALLGLQNTVQSIVTLKYFFFSPNLVWFSMAAAVWLYFPYDIEAFRDGFHWVPCLQRLALNFTYPFIYYFYWYFTLYQMNWGSRKFLPPRPTNENMAHDLYYWFLGILQFTAWECVMMRLWAAGAVPYSTNAEILASPGLLALNIFWVLAIPIWRDLHFYLAHRFIHIRCIYKYVHSFHHRQYDPEPFSGLCMHPAEHLPYYSNAFIPSLIMNLSPAIFLWNFVHLVIAPGAGHSGFEDHWQADQYHYLHHAKFECNYGSPMSGFIDQYMGTFREKMGDSATYKGEWSADVDLLPPAADAAQQRPWSSKGHLGIQTDSNLAYTLFCLAAMCFTIWGIVLNTGPSRIANLGPVPVEDAVAFVIGYGPFICAFVLCILTKDPMSWRWPFQHENVIGGFGFFGVAAWLACINPIYFAVKWACQL